MIRFECAVAATRGARDYQEDCAAFWPDGGDPFFVQARSEHGAQSGAYAVLADGMGGHTGGALASRIVCEQFLASVAAHEGAVRASLLDGLDAANAAIAAKVEDSPLLSGMGSTLIGVVVQRRRLGVGQCRRQSAVFFPAR